MRDELKREALVRPVEQPTGCLDRMGCKIKHTGSVERSRSGLLWNMFAPIEYKTPKAGLSAGRILKHSKDIVDGLLAKHAPMIFKIGYTHDPQWRWGNDIYGYHKDLDRWSTMVVVFETNEPYSPAMLEAALIDIYKCLQAPSSIPFVKNLEG